MRVVKQPVAVPAAVVPTGVEAAAAGIDISAASFLIEIEISPCAVIVSECTGDPVFANPNVRAKDEAPAAEFLVR